MSVPVNWGRVFAWGQVALCLAASIGYAFSRQHAKALYWFFAACISVTVIFL